MAHTSLKRRALPLTFAALAASSVLSSQHALAATSAKKYTGSVADQGRWGPIQVTITVENKKITNVTAAVSPDNPRSNFIESQAIPLLRQEVLRAQSANIQLVSGATDISQAYVTSLQAAVKKATTAEAL